jgi:GNAT superfamily N-acetyltransferase
LLKETVTLAIHIRKIQASDKVEWLELYHAYLKFYESEPTDFSTELVWSRLTKSDPEIQGLVAEEDGEIVGICHFHYQLSTWSNTWNCYLEDLYVSEASRGQGVARALIAEVKKKAIERSCTELFWITKESNAVARRLYDKVANVSDFIRYEISLEE